MYHVCPLIAITHNKILTSAHARQTFNNLPRLFARTFRKGSCKPLLEVARMRKHSPRVAHARGFKIIPAPPSALVENTLVWAAWAPKFIKYEHGAWDLHPCEGPAFCGSCIFRLTKSTKSTSSNWLPNIFGICQHLQHIQSISILFQCKSRHYNTTCQHFPIFCVCLSYAHEFNICRFFSTSIDALQHRSTIPNIFCSVQAMSTYSSLAEAFQHQSAHVRTCQHSARLCDTVLTMSKYATYADPFPRISKPHKIYEHLMTFRHNNTTCQDCPTFGAQLNLC
jgi:hypothetical protein